MHDPKRKRLEDKNLDKTYKTAIALVKNICAIVMSCK